MPAWLSYYLHPTSMTWWVSVAETICGLIVILSVLDPAITSYTNALAGLWAQYTGIVGIGGIGLFAGGLKGIGVRAAIADSLAKTLSDAANRAPITTLAGDVGSVFTSATAPASSGP